MRASHVSAIGAAAAAALALPLGLPLPSAASAPAAPRPAAVADDDGTVPGSTRSLPLTRLDTARSADPDAGPAAQGLLRRDVEPFSLVGVVWDDPAAELRGTVQVRTRSAATREWSPWQDLENHHHDHGADPGTPEGTSTTLRGSTAPLWVGASDGVEVRVRPDKPAQAADGTDAPVTLPRGLRVELVDPGDEPPGGAQDQDRDQDRDDDRDRDESPGQGREGPPADPDRGAGAALSDEESVVSEVNGDMAALGAPEIRELSKADTEASAPGHAKPYIGPRPRIVTRKGWGADEGLREPGFVYTKSVQAAFVHHSATGNNYTCAQASSVLRSIYRYHVRSMGWRDIGYNFAIDKCGNIYEGRAGGVARPVQGAHTLGFNTNTTGIAVLGSFGTGTPPAAAVTAVARLTAWKLGLYGKDPRVRTTLTSGGGNLYKKGTKVQLNVISGHRDGYNTECPGTSLYSKLGTARSAAADYQGRP
ncbi:peptidoglycan recognition protein [Streptomyces coeruleoprunus]|uniref:Peptidoglycan recognition protein n=1 Tax=Streptomyces coeruleoprunus TaxID=285563 RepID=A0ABV9XHZ7_9ACTN